jgi:hypothetical protein
MGSSAVVVSVFARVPAGAGASNWCPHAWQESEPAFPGDAASGTGTTTGAEHLGHVTSMPGYYGIGAE